MSGFGEIVEGFGYLAHNKTGGEEFELAQLEIERKRAEFALMQAKKAAKVRKRIVKSEWARPPHCTHPAQDAPPECWHPSWAGKMTEDFCAPCSMYERNRR